jgi:ABC-type branched-subunit amino acid transport system substrate-binding protein
MPNPKDPRNWKFVNTFKNKYGYEPDLVSAQPYDALYALAAAIFLPD